MARQFSTRVRLATLLAVILVTARCDVPTTGPDFSYDTGIRTPMVFDKTFVLIGPSEDGLEALIDTTKSPFNSLLNVDPSDRTIFIEQSLDDFEIEALDSGMPKLSIDEQNVAISLDQLVHQQFSSTFDETLEIFTLDPSDPLTPPEVGQELPFLPNSGGGVTEILFPNFLVPPLVNLVTLSDVSLQSVRFTDERNGFNAFRFEIINDLAGETLTAASDPSMPPEISVFQNGSEIGRRQFGFISPGERATVEISLAGRTLSSDGLVYRMDVSTASGPGPLLDNPGSVRLATRFLPLRYGESTVTEIPAQSNIETSFSDLRFEGLAEDVYGMIASSAPAVLKITNTLPVSLVLENFEVYNLDPVGSYDSGFIFFAISGLNIAPGATTTVPIELGQRPVALRIAAQGSFSSPGTASTVQISSEMGIFTSIEGDVTLEEVYMKPTGAVYSSSASLDVSVPDVHFDAPDDHVTFESGALSIDRLVNAMDLGFENIMISLPGLRLPPYQVQDSLVIRFQGSTDDPDAFRFRRIGPGEFRYGLVMDLADVRAYPQDNMLSYNIYARTETSSDTRLIRLGDRPEAFIRVENATLKDLAATIDPISVAVTEDVNGDGVLDVMDDDEAIVLQIDELEDLGDQTLNGLELIGTELSITIESFIGTSVDIFAALVGTSPDGSRLFLGGRGEHAVSPGDSLIGRIVADGIPLGAEQMIRLHLDAPAGGQPSSTQTILLNNSNSNVDEFLSELPTGIRFAGQAILQAEGGHVQIATPFSLDASIGISLPLHIGSDFSFDETLDADLSSLDDLTDPEGEFVLKRGSLELAYSNGIPLGLNARLEFLNDVGDIEVSFPKSGGDPLALYPAHVTAAGTTESPTSGLLEIVMDEADARRLSNTRQLRLRLAFIRDDSRTARLRASDQITLSMRGDFRFEVSVDEK